MSLHGGVVLQATLLDIISPQTTSPVKMPASTPGCKHPCLISISTVSHVQKDGVVGKRLRMCPILILVAGGRVPRLGKSNQLTANLRYCYREWRNPCQSRSCLPLASFLSFKATEISQATQRHLSSTALSSNTL